MPPAGQSPLTSLSTSCITMGFKTPLYRFRRFQAEHQRSPSIRFAASNTADSSPTIQLSKPVALQVSATAFYGAEAPPAGRIRRDCVHRPRRGKHAQVVHTSHIFNGQSGFAAGARDLTVTGGQRAALAITVCRHRADIGKVRSSSAILKRSFVFVN